MPTEAQIARSPIARKDWLRHFYSVLFSLSLIFVAVPPGSAAESGSLKDAAKQLADRLANIPNFHGPVRLEFLERNKAAASGADEEWKAAMRDELESRHVTVTQDSNALALRVAVTQTPTQMVMTAAIKLGEREEVRIVTTSRAAAPAENLPVAAVRLERQLVYESADRILDASTLWNGEEKGMALLLLRKAELLAIKLDGNGAVTQTVSLATAYARLGRDPRAELLPKGAQTELHISGRACEFAWTAATDVKCRNVKQVWREAATLTAPCDSGDWKLEADGNDWTTPDLLQAVPADSTRQNAAAAIAEFPGPVLSINGEQNPSNALIVIRNLRTGNYEVYKITLACGD